MKNAKNNSVEDSLIDFTDFFRLCWKNIFVIIIFTSVFTFFTAAYVFYLKVEPLHYFNVDTEIKVGKISNSLIFNISDLNYLNSSFIYLSKNKFDKSSLKITEVNKYELFEITSSSPDKKEAELIMDNFIQYLLKQSEIKLQKITEKLDKKLLRYNEFISQLNDSITSFNAIEAATPMEKIQKISSIMAFSAKKNELLNSKYIIEQDKKIQGPDVQNSGLIIDTKTIKKVYSTRPINNKVFILAGAFLGLFTSIFLILAMDIYRKRIYKP